MLSSKNLVFKERPVKNLMKRYMEPYMIEKVCYDLRLKVWSKERTCIIQYERTQ